MKKWNELPHVMQNQQVYQYYVGLKNKKNQLRWKRRFDIGISFCLLVILFPVMLIISILIATTSEGPILFRQKRVTQYGRIFTIYKFRTMVNDAERLGTLVTTKNDARVTEVGGFLRKYRLDELPQLINILKGDMTLVGARPEVIHYVKCYTDEMKATLLLPAGVTSEASIQYKDEEKILSKADKADEVYIRCVLPEKMKYNLAYLNEFSVFQDLKVIIHTVFALFYK